MEHKNHFSKIGLFLFASSFFICTEQLLAVTIYRQIPGSLQHPSLTYLLGMLPLYVIIFPIALLLFKRLSAPMPVMKKKISAGKFVLAFLICYAMTYICNLVARFVCAIIGMSLYNNMADLTSYIHPAVLFFLTVLCAPVMEELLFRKALISHTIQYGEGISILLSGFTFGLFQDRLDRFAAAFVLGIFLGFLYTKTGNIIYTIILHICFDFIDTFLSAFILNTYTDLQYTASTDFITLITEHTSQMLPVFIYFFFILVMIISGFILFVVNRKKLRTEPGIIRIEKEKRFSIIILNAGMILYITFRLILIILSSFR